MDNKTYDNLSQLVLALKSYLKAVEKSFHIGSYEGTTDIILRQYRTLYDKALQMLPDDFYVREMLALNITQDGMNERNVVSQVMLVSEQLLHYLRDLLKEDRQPSIAKTVDDVRDLGREFQEQILSVTKHTLRRALANIDLDISVSDEPQQSTDSEPKAEG
jgi:hypothetical protein